MDLPREDDSQNTSHVRSTTGSSKKRSKLREIRKEETRKAINGSRIQRGSYLWLRKRDNDIETFRCTEFLRYARSDADNARPRGVKWLLDLPLETSPWTETWSELVRETGSWIHCGSIFRYPDIFTSTPGSAYRGTVGRMYFIANSVSVETPRCDAHTCGGEVIRTNGAYNLMHCIFSYLYLYIFVPGTWIFKASEFCFNGKKKCSRNVFTWNCSLLVILIILY